MQSRLFHCNQIIIIISFITLLSFQFRFIAITANQLFSTKTSKLLNYNRKFKQLHSNIKIQMASTTSYANTSENEKTAGDFLENLQKNTVPMISQKEPLCNVLSCDHLCIAVSNFETAIGFYKIIGFEVDTSLSTNTIKVIHNVSGLKIHLILCDKGIDDNCNLLMDYPQQKYPGHTHAAFHVASVGKVVEYFEKNNLKTTGERKFNDVLQSVFLRDTDRTTIEFEKHSTEHEASSDTQEDVKYCTEELDHIGIRVTNPEKALLFYAEKFGFNLLYKKYEPNPEPLKNFPPWISKSINGVFINLIINSNTPVTENILIANQVVRPGILYPGYVISEDLQEVAKKLQEAGVFVMHEEDLSTSKFQCFINRFIPCNNGSLFVEDEDLNIIRLFNKSN